jgi:hypothetical protein
MVRRLNWTGVLAALVFAQGLSFLWYGLLFGHKLHALMSPKARTPLGMVEGAALALLMFIGLAVVLRRMNQDGWARGALGGLLLWAVFPLTGELMNTVYMGEGLDLLEANVGYELIVLTVGGALIGGLKLGRRRRR